MAEDTRHNGSKDLTKADFKQAYWQLFCALPIEKITVSDLCKRAGYNRGTFYLHFEGLDDLLGTIEAEVMAGMLACVERALKACCGNKLGLPLAMADVLAYYSAHKQHIKPLLGEKRDPAFLVALVEDLKPLWRRYVIGEHTGRSDAEIDLILEQAISGGLSMIGDWLMEPKVSEVQLAKLVYDVCIRDVSNRANA